MSVLHLKYKSRFTFTIASGSQVKIHGICQYSKLSIWHGQTRYNIANGMHIVKLQQDFLELIIVDLYLLALLAELWVSYY